MLIVDETTFEDGSAWTAVVRVRNVVYRASFVACKLSIGLAPYKHRPRSPRWAEEAVRKWAEGRIAALSTSWMTAHVIMYAEPDSDAV